MSFVLEVAEHSLLHALVLMRSSTRTKIATKKKQTNIAPKKWLLNCSIPVPYVFFPSYNNTRCCRFYSFVRIVHLLESFSCKKCKNFEGFSRWLWEPNWMQRMRSWTQNCEWMIFFTISTISERRVFFNNHSIEFHKIWQRDTSDSV